MHHMLPCRHELISVGEPADRIFLISKGEVEIWASANSSGGMGSLFSGSEASSVGAGDGGEDVFDIHMHVSDISSSPTGEEV
jgi:hypothetical protein